MRTARVQIVNDAGAVKSGELGKVVKALARQVRDHFAPAWGIGCELDVVPRARLAKDAWVLTLAVDFPSAADDGWHELGPHGQPCGIVSVKDAIADSGEWTSTASHELLELLADPAVALSGQHDADGHAHAFAMEVCDPVQACRYELGGVKLSNFVTPAWFEEFRPPKTCFDWMERCKHPFHVVTGGYVLQAKQDYDKGWNDVWWHPQKRGHLHGSRRRKRNTPRSDWKRSARTAPKR